mmetsp:Transcript_5547/g.11551  ORF Transcript_5547/g.11551 Transcript_5547/m.11551 type:complete len:256 (+) Transcript_5547:190-957(+)
MDAHARRRGRPKDALIVVPLFPLIRIGRLRFPARPFFRLQADGEPRGHLPRPAGREGLGVRPPKVAVVVHVRDVMRHVVVRNADPLARRQVRRRPKRVAEEADGRPERRKQPRLVVEPLPKGGTCRFAQEVDRIVARHVPACLRVFLVDDRSPSVGESRRDLLLRRHFPSRQMPARTVVPLQSGVEEAPHLRRHEGRLGRLRQEQPVPVGDGHRGEKGATGRGGGRSGRRGEARMPTARRAKVPEAGYEGRRNRK